MTLCHQQFLLKAIVDVLDAKTSHSKPGIEQYILEMLNEISDKSADRVDRMNLIENNLKLYSSNEFENS